MPRAPGPQVGERRAFLRILFAVAHGLQAQRAKALGQLVLVREVVGMDRLAVAALAHREGGVHEAPSRLHRGRERGKERAPQKARAGDQVDRKSTRLNSSHLGISYAVFCLKKKNKKEKKTHA